MGQRQCSHYRIRLFCRFFFSALSNTHSGTATILVDEFHAGGFERTSDYVQRRPARFVYRGLELTNRHDSNGCCVGELLLTPVE